MIRPQHLFWALGWLVSCSTANAARYLCNGWSLSDYSDACPTGSILSAFGNYGCGCTLSESVHWTGGNVVFAVENQGIGNLLPGEFSAAAVKAVQVWTDVTCSTLTAAIGGSFTPIAPAPWNSNPGIHGIYVVESETEWIDLVGAGSGGTLGIANPSFSGPSCGSLEFIDADIILNGIMQNFWTPERLERVLLHELGHAFWLGHECLTQDIGCPNGCTSIMAAAGADLPTLQQDDINAICALYPGTSNDFGSACNSAAPSCTSGPCITIGGESYCTQNCAASCPEGYDCRNLNNTSVCVRRGLPNVDEPCAFNCATGATCVATDPDPLTGTVCLQVCSDADSSCMPNSRCVVLSSGSHVCYPFGPQLLGDPCDVYVNSDCAAGLICVQDAPGTLAPTHCYKRCNPLLQDCAQNELCISDPNASEVHAGYCQLNLDRGAPCDANQPCNAGLVCRMFTVENQGFCTVACDPTSNASCAPAEHCLNTYDINGQPAGSACVNSGTRSDGESCLTAAECLDTLWCENSICQLPCEVTTPCADPTHSCILGSDGVHRFCTPIPEPEPTPHPSPRKKHSGCANLPSTQHIAIPLLALVGFRRFFGTRSAL